ncbi:putative peptidyl-prolyl cis-trans isomerase (cyclophilin- 40) [Leptomonas pyrrhocoris]|uniref:peptidylprolyl isomerase n=1 Tax=Leptomonas pyrrhocoris TaxID=157538 RepID=A0A0M9GAZ6_LEPPY|nr:putative peptidyl-prolyl cis-trans isomerase (cyclophilin- 40) [Leptomonas pyrrhocoris]XP_015665031.1 putative peptidyl-prolyl cis-trans isomerase (cyclophilin- 40) [Leptomonas pyrrhocoris]XP_015665032.1 putative peptidyl-prolyl cis-trans isomerase (cyclophilin- 40) [Leptomonas pyrrhocoris]KPA86591.1 putative peptidyl-prolyl cis-trans isomerase (cyclophilin- 40) [Leptomonas pyrrhocoris]KPA86592.1 putative peptidyl-prolyl cis-trans isomerase (cyclophilin- 40) [Leptomonas pyrrhocoris]KPA86593|eukprot:XP_015665030.1 putative peptidyl-prolyl cis-trans isomerase (cyclophilin- 40) [Leptomonas pyrrhocoris]
MSNAYCYFDVTIGGKPLKERIVMELFTDVTPKTCENFRQLCLGNGGKTVEGTEVPMTYKGSSFHRVIAGFMIQGGDFTNHNGTGGVSIYGEKFEDENFEVPCDKSGLLAMANAGANTNGSQFFITTAPAPHLTGRHVVFGRVVRGMNAVRAVEQTATGANDKPVEDCLIADCGELDALPEVVPAADGDTYPDYPEDVVPAMDDAQRIEAGEAIRQIGNTYFKNAAYALATDKYQKAVRFLVQVENQEAHPEVKEKLIACYNNTAMCAIKLERWADARHAASLVLNLDPKNAKALFRRGMAALNGSDADGAVEDLTQAHQMEPDNAEITAKLNEAKGKVKAQKAKLAANFKKMFS